MNTDPNARPQDASHWESIYQDGSPGWDIGGPAPPFVDLIASGIEWLSSKGRILQPGCGNGHDAKFFAQNGYAVTAVDFAPSAVANLKRIAADLPTMRVIEADIYDLPTVDGTRYDYVVEHTCFCAIPRENRKRWFETMAAMLKPNGILFGLFYRFDPPDDNGPPFAVSEDELLALATPHFECMELRIPQKSHGRRQNRERFCVFRKNVVRQFGE